MRKSEKWMKPMSRLNKRLTFNNHTVPYTTNMTSHPPLFLHLSVSVVFLLPCCHGPSAQCQNRKPVRGLWQAEGTWRHAPSSPLQLTKYPSRIHLKWINSWRLLQTIATTLAATLIPYFSSAQLLNCHLVAGKPPSSPALWLITLLWLMQACKSPESILSNC